MVRMMQNLILLIKMIIQPLLERRDYTGENQLDKNKVQKKGGIMDNVEKIANEIIASERIAVSPPGWSGTTRAMKRHKEIDNPFKLAWWMSKQRPGAKWGPGGKLTKKPEPHYKPEKKKKKSNDDINLRVAAITDIILAEPIQPIDNPMTSVNITSSKSYSTIDSVKVSDGDYVNIRTNYKEENGQPILEEYVVDKNGDVKTYDNTEDFVARLITEGLMQI